MRLEDFEPCHTHTCWIFFDHETGDVYELPRSWAKTEQQALRIISLVEQEKNDAFDRGVEHGKEAARDEIRRVLGVPARNVFA